MAGISTAATASGVSENSAAAAFSPEVPTQGTTILPHHGAIRANVPTAEVANSITHGLGLVLSVVAAVVLLHTAENIHGWPWAAVAIYAATMVAVYAASTASHVFSQPRARHFF